MMIVVGLDDGIILDLSRCVIFDDSTIGDADQRLLNVGTESDAISVATRHGVKLDNLLARSGYGELHYGNCLSLTPSALHQEFVEIPALLPENSDEIEGVKAIKELFAWGASLTPEELVDLSNNIMMDEDMWDAWRTAVVSHLEYRYNEHMEKKS